MFLSQASKPQVTRMPVPKSGSFQVGGNGLKFGTIRGTSIFKGLRADLGQLQTRSQRVTSFQSMGVLPGFPPKPKQDRQAWPASKQASQACLTVPKSSQVNVPRRVPRTDSERFQNGLAGSRSRRFPSRAQEGRTLGS